MLPVLRDWKKYVILFAIIIIVASSTSVRPARAYRSNGDTVYSRLPSSMALLWIFYDYINSGLGISNSYVYTAHAMNQWDIASYYTVFDAASTGTNTQSTNTIIIRDFNQFFLTPCNNLQNYTAFPAITCQPNKVIYLNSSSYWQWNTTGGMYAFYDPGCNCSRRAVDYLTIILHELGHYWGLAHPASVSASVMYPDFNTAKQNLLDDDKQGAVQYYGPYSGWETNVTLGWFSGYTYVETKGLPTETLYNLNTDSQQLIPLSTELGVTPYSGSRYLKFYGNSQAANSYAYMKLFSADKDELLSNPNHLVIQSGMKLIWSQYNHVQTRMSLDIVFSDGTTLRDSGLKDQNNVRVHPSFRGGYTIGVWRQFVVDLSSLAGKRVKHILVAYDNANNGQTGIFRSYFDNIELNY